VVALNDNIRHRLRLSLTDQGLADAIINAVNNAIAGTLDDLTAGTVVASKVVTVDANKDVSAFRDVTTRKVAIGDSANDHTITLLSASDEASNRTLTVPALGGNKTLACADLAQTLSAAQTFTGGIVVTTAGVTITDVDIVLGTTTGTKIGTATSQKLGFYNATPIVQPSAYTQTYATADKTHANPTAAALTVTDGAGTNDGTIGAITDNASTIAAVQELADQINKLVADQADTKQLINSIIDDLQTLGLVG
jgi:hypothetical protein